MMRFLVHAGHRLVKEEINPSVSSKNKSFHKQLMKSDVRLHMNQTACIIYYRNFPHFHTGINASIQVSSCTCALKTRGLAAHGKSLLTTSFSLKEKKTC